MDYRKIRAVFFIIVFLLALALIVHWAVGLDDSRRAAREEEQQIEEPTPPPAEDTPTATCSGPSRTRRKSSPSVT